MSVRITSQTMNARVLEDLRSAQVRVARHQQEVTTGRRITQASDDALGTSDALRARTALDGLAGHRSSVAGATDWTTATDAALGQMTNVAHRVRELTLQAANTATTDSGRAAIAAEIGQLIDTVKDAANAKVGDAYVFGGTATTTRPYTPGPSDAYAGDAGAVARSIGPGVSLQVNTTGAQAIGSGGGDGLLLDTLRGIRTSLLANDVAALGTTHLQALRGNLDTLTDLRATVGATENRLLAADARLSDAEMTTAALLERTESADLAESLIHLSAQSAAYQAALKTAATVLPPSLLDFLR